MEKNSGEKKYLKKKIPLFTEWPSCNNHNSLCKYSNNDNNNNNHNNNNDNNNNNYDNNNDINNNNNSNHKNKWFMHNLESVLENETRNSQRF